MSYDFKRLSDVEVVAEPAESANVLIEENGVIKKASKDAVGGATSWNDLTDKPFYENVKKIEINETCHITANNEVKNEVLAYVMENVDDVSNITVTLVANDTYFEDIFGGTYKMCYKESGTYENDGSSVVYVNYALVDSSGRVNDRVSVKYNALWGIEVLCTVNTPDGQIQGTATFTGYYIESDVKPMDGKYIKDMYYEKAGAKETLVFFGTHMQLFLQDEVPFAMATGLTFDDVLNAGDKCMIVVSGTETDEGEDLHWGTYECTAFDIAELMGITDASIICLGDPYYASAPESMRTNEAPFLFVPSEGVVFGEAGTYTFRIFKIENEVKTIDPKYLPSQCQRIVFHRDVDSDNRDIITYNGNYITNELVIALAKTGAPVFVHDIEGKAFSPGTWRVNNSGDYYLYVDYFYNWDDEIRSIEVSFFTEIETYNEILEAWSKL